MSPDRVLAEIADDEGRTIDVVSLEAAKAIASGAEGHRGNGLSSAARRDTSAGSSGLPAPRMTSV